MKIWRLILLPVLLLGLVAGLGLPAQAAAVQQKKLLVELRREGGFAGFSDRVRVYTNSCVRLSRRTGPTVDKCLTRAEWRTLKAHLKRLKLGRSQARPQGADFLKYTLTYRGHRVSKYQLTKTWSPVVRDLEKALEKYWAPD
ncbi:hypothetical protein [Nonomuraea endophytica]|uniref:Uncharacterized protein n=1 Tax=Nonomuraea endophytica TaxID=714136 RepID=A0A7W8EHL2_9ACTN|nr:hypothetical protein [Nonomuraea endophytica]MBB5078717.1 hypothetical protein [Nonomuraea endophytica]